MANILAFPPIPDNVPCTTDPRGRTMHLYSYGFIHEGVPLSFEMWAYSDEDAARRVDSLRASVVLEFQLLDIISEEYP